MNTNEDIDAVVRETLGGAGPTICEVMVSPEERTLPRVAARQDADGRMVSSPMEDMSPLLDRDEFDEIMSIQGGADGQNHS